MTAEQVTTGTTGHSSMAHLRLPVKKLATHNTQSVRNAKTTGIEKATPTTTGQIQSGNNTHHHEIVMAPVSLSTVRTSAAKGYIGNELFIVFLF